LFLESSWSLLCLGFDVWHMAAQQRWYLISAGCRIDFDLDHDEACSKQIDDLCWNNMLNLLIAGDFCRRVRLILKMKVLRVRSVVIIISTWRASCLCFNPTNLPRGNRGSRLCGEDRDRETENSKVCARDTRQNIYTGLGRQGGEPYVLFGGSSMAHCVWCWVGCSARYPALLYILQGAGS
jgi:hypothetical protein